VAIVSVKERFEMSDAPDSRFEYLRVPAMALPTIPPDQFAQVKQGWDYVRHAMLGLAAQRILRDSIPGDMAEAGVWRGDCARFIHVFAPDRILYLFDTFEGFPGEEDTRFRDTAVDVVRQVVGPSENIIIKKGIFPHTTSGLEENKFALVSLDLDTYEGISEGWKFFYPRMSRGGFIFVHDFNATEYNFGPFRATTDFLSNKLEKIIELPDQWGSALIRKV
jgi:O-methyltransferase